MIEAHDMLEAAGKDWKTNVLETATDRFERRLSEELGNLRVEMAQEFASTRVSLLRWSFAFWVTQLAATLGMAAFLFDALKGR